MPTSAYIHSSLGNIYARQHQWTQAQQAYFEAYHYDNTRADYAYNLAISLDHLNQPRLAIIYYQQALQLARNQTIQFSLPIVQRRLQVLQIKTNTTITVPSRLAIERSSTILPNQRFPKTP
jgi:tetratricopeptide (TPR) repeat protein